jgi:DNA uptake protein ComE-like DNA-binding protein
MPRDFSDTAQTHQKVYIPRAGHLLCYLFLGLLLGGSLLARFYYPFFIDHQALINRERAGQIDQRIDPNTASWQELACLPAIGEVKAKRIVQYRHERGVHPESKVSAVFRHPDDLRAIRGIGPKTTQKISPYLKFPVPSQSDSSLTPRGTSP